MRNDQIIIIYNVFIFQTGKLLPYTRFHIRRRTRTIFANSGRRSRNPVVASSLLNTTCNAFNTNYHFNTLILRLNRRPKWAVTVKIHFLNYRPTYDWNFTQQYMKSAIHMVGYVCTYYDEYIRLNILQPKISHFFFIFMIYWWNEINSQSRTWESSYINYFKQLA